MHKYRLVAKKGEGTFSEVLKAQCIKNGKYVAIKCMKNHFDSLDQVNNLREIQALRRLSPHANIIKLQEVLYDQPTGRLALVFELMDMNIYELIRGRRHYVAEDRVKNYMYQLMKAMDHMHRNGIFHRDIKPENILIMDDCLKLADFGSCRGIYSKQPYTEYISTRWYRAPECLLTDGYYNYKMDMWGVGCVFFEIMSLFPLFPGTNELDQIQKIHNILGTPPAELLAKMKKRSAHMDFNFPAKEGTGIAKLIPHVSPDCVDLIVKLLMYNPDDRLSARQALRHPYFRELREAEKRQKALMNPEFSAALSAQPSAASQGHMGMGMGSLTSNPDDVKSARHHQGSAGSEETSANANAGTMSPPETSRMAEQHNAALPSISKASHTYPQGNHGSHSLHAGHSLSHHAGSMGSHSLHAAHNDNNHHHGGVIDDGLDVSNSYRLPGLHAESSMDAMSQAQGENGLPPIGNLSLGKAGMAVGGAGSNARRGLPNYYEGSGHVVQGATYGKGKAVAGMAKRTGLPGQAQKYTSTKNGVPPGLVGQVTVAGHKVAPISGVQDLGANPSNSSSYKFKANASSSKQVPKYMSPYALRNLVAVGKE